MSSYVPSADLTELRLQIPLGSQGLNFFLEENPAVRSANPRIFSLPFGKKVPLKSSLSDSSESGNDDFVRSKQLAATRTVR